VKWQSFEIILIHAGSSLQCNCHHHDLQLIHSRQSSSSHGSLALMCRNDFLGWLALLVLAPTVHAEIRFEHCYTTGNNGRSGHIFCCTAGKVAMGQIGQSPPYSKSTKPMQTSIGLLGRPYKSRPL